MRRPISPRPTLAVVLAKVVRSLIKTPQPICPDGHSASPSDSPLFPCSAPSPFFSFLNASLSSPFIRFNLTYLSRLTQVFCWLSPLAFQSSFPTLLCNQSPLQYLNIHPTLTHPKPAPPPSNMEMTSMKLQSLASFTQRRLETVQHGHLPRRDPAMRS